ncbi:hypothetical protein B4Q13_17210, partial [Lacticaseibacillus rhamnosus]
MVGPGQLWPPLITVACTNKKVSNPIANVDSKKPDKVLFDRAMEAMKHNRFDVARLSLQTLINPYPDSEFVARAKLAEVQARTAKTVEPTPEAEAEWVKRVTRPTFMTAYQEVCTPGYYNGEGKQEGQGFLEAQDPDGAVRCYEMLARWREQGEY